MMRRESKWTSVYLDSNYHGRSWYIRFTPTFMELEKAGFGHGLSLSGNMFETKEAANACADTYDTFFDAMAAALIKQDTPIGGNELIHGELPVVREFQEWLNDRRMQDVSEAFHGIVTKFRKVATADAEPTEAMLNAARDWSVKKYGIGIGNDAAIGCWKAMHAAKEL